MFKEKLIAFLKRIAFDKKTIELYGQPYLTRYYLFGRGDSWFGAYLHEFHRSDADRDLHNHPWMFATSFILKGQYTEEQLTRNLMQRVRKYFNFFFGSHFHRIAHIEKGLHTLFIRGPVTSDWGFLTPDEDGKVVFVPWRDYVNARKHQVPEKLTPTRVNRDILRGRDHDSGVCG